MGLEIRVSYSGIIVNHSYSLSVLIQDFLKRNACQIFNNQRETVSCYLLFLSNIPLHMKKLNLKIQGRIDLLCKQSKSLY